MGSRLARGIQCGIMTCKRYTVLWDHNLQEVCSMGSRLARDLTRIHVNDSLCCFSMQSAFCAFKVQSYMYY